LFCKAGEDVDIQLEKAGAKRIVPLQKTDVDFETPAQEWVNNILNALSASTEVVKPVKTEAVAITPKSKEKIIYNFKNESNSIKNLFSREGRNYSFGPMPLVWHQEVWKSLEKYYLKPKNINILEAIRLYPLESRWYGEALLKYQAIPLLPCEPFFKVYHYAWQFDQDQRRGIRNEELSHIFSGVIYQSAWERNMDWPEEYGRGFSILARKIRRIFSKI
jgi:hypothetical protein